VRARSPKSTPNWTTMLVTEVPSGWVGWRQRDRRGGVLQSTESTCRNWRCFLRERDLLTGRGPGGIIYYPSDDLHPGLAWSVSPSGFGQFHPAPSTPDSRHQCAAPALSHAIRGRRCDLPSSEARLGSTTEVHDAVQWVLGWWDTWLCVPEGIGSDA
jgi:hypothetical protein